MTSENGGMFNMPVMPASYGGNGGFGFDNGWWIIIILILFGGWGNNGWGNNGGGNGSEIQRGFDQSALTTGINGIQNSLLTGFNNLQSNFQNCCCENRLGLADVKYTVATEACADRNAISMALRDVIEANNNSTQRILDTMCQDKIDAKNETIAMLRQQLQMAEMAASQNAQTAAIVANNEAQTMALERYLAPTPVPAYVVQNPNCCQQNWGCGCGMAS